MDNPETQTPIKPQHTSRSTAIIAILLSLVAIGLSARNYFCESVTTTSITQQLKAQASIINDLRNTVITVQKYKSVETPLSLASIYFYIAAANVNVTINHDSQAAIQALLSAAHIIASQSNNTFNTLNEAIRADIQALRSVSTIHINTTYTEIETLKDDIVKLSSLPIKPNVSLNNTINSVKTADNKTQSWHEKLLNSLKKVKNLFVIRHLDQTNMPVLDAQLEIMVKQNIVMQLNIAEWALLHRNQVVYNTALQNVSKQLAQYFSMMAISQSMIAKLTALQKLTIQPVFPTLSNTLNALAAVKMHMLPNEPIQSPIIESPHPLLQPKILQQPKNQNPMADVET